MRDLVQGAFFTRAPGDSSMAVWVGGSDVAEGEKLLDEVQATYFGPFRLSTMLDSDGCNTTSATAIALIAKDRDLQGPPRGGLGGGTCRAALGGAPEAGGL